MTISSNAICGRFCAFVFDTKIYIELSIILSNESSIAFVNRSGSFWIHKLFTGLFSFTIKLNLIIKYLSTLNFNVNPAEKLLPYENEHNLPRSTRLLQKMVTTQAKNIFPSEEALLTFKKFLLLIFLSVELRN